MTNDLDTIKESIKAICTANHVSCILFGSRINGTPHTNSDLDMALVGSDSDVLETTYQLHEEVDSAIRFDILHLKDDIKEGNPTLYKEIIEHGEEL